MKKFLPKKINIYIAKDFMKKFLQIMAAFSLLIFFINFLEALDKAASSNIPSLVVFEMAFLKISDFLNDIAPTLILFAGIFTFFSLSIKSEITIVRTCGFSLWSIVMPVAISAFLIGIFWVTIFGPLSIKMARQFDYLEGKYIKNEMREIVAPTHGIWFKQSNIEKPGEEIVIRAQKVFKDNLEFDDATFWFFDNTGRFYRKIDSVEMMYKDTKWVLNNVVINDDQSLNKKIDTVEIPTNLQRDFIMDKVVTNFQNVKIFSIYNLPSTIRNLELAGFQSAKFKVYFNSLLSKPFLFFSMALIACFFGINHARNQKSYLMIFFGIVTGLAMYIGLSFIGALGSSRLIPVFASTWVITFICIAIGVLLIYKKESI